MKKIRVLLCPENGEPRMTKLEDRLPELQRAVGGYIEAVTLSTDPRVILICDEEGRIKGKEKNRNLPDPILFGLGSWNIVGDCFLCGAHGADFTDLPESMVSQLLRSARESYASQNH